MSPEVLLSAMYLENEDYIDSPFYTNHDISRSAGYYQSDWGVQQLKLSHAMNLLMSGSAFLYYGEELGMRGSKTAAYGINPDAAVVVDVSFAHTPDADKSSCGTLGGGVMLGISPILDMTLTQSLRAVAEKAVIPLQCEVMGGTTGTDADVVSITAKGVPTALLSIPLRYMHTPAEVVSLRDIQAVGDLIAALVLEGEVSCHA